MIELSVPEASFRIARKAAIRMLSSAVDHSSRHFYGSGVSAVSVTSLEQKWTETLR